MVSPYRNTQNCASASGSDLVYWFSTCKISSSRCKFTMQDVPKTIPWKYNFWTEALQTLLLVFELISTTRRTRKTRSRVNSRQKVFLHENYRNFTIGLNRENLVLEFSWDPDRWLMTERYFSRRNSTRGIDWHHSRVDPISTFRDIDEKSIFP